MGLGLRLWECGLWFGDTVQLLSASSRQHRGPLLLGTGRTCVLQPFLEEVFIFL